jgi:hypothetical protein
VRGRLQQECRHFKLNRAQIFTDIHRYKFFNLTVLQEDQVTRFISIDEYIFIPDADDGE